MNSLVSVIIPVYNDEQYIRRAIEGVLVQTYSNWELILVDDGSTDSSGDICDEYSGNNIFVFHKNNGGVSSARNMGLSKAKGDYIAFVDSDDYFDKDYLEKLIQGEGSDVVIAGYCYGDSPVTLDYRGAYDFNEICQHINEFLRTDYFCYPWGKLFRRNLVVGNEICFDENMHFAEDHVFNWSCLKYVRTIFFIDAYVYHKNTLSPTNYHLSFHEIDYIDNSLYNTAKDLELVFHCVISPSPQTFCHTLFQEDCITNHSVSEYIQYYLKYHPTATQVEALDFIARFNYHPALTSIASLGKREDSIIRLKSLQLFIDHPLKLFSSTKIKTRFLIPLIKLRFYNLIYTILQVIYRNR